MTDAFDDKSIAAIQKTLKDYFDGLYDGDVAKFEQVFHECAHLYFTDGNTVTDWPRQEYFDRIASRESPASQNLPRWDRIISMHKAGPHTAMATVNCAIPPRYFTDYLTLMETDSGWRITSKSFHVDVHD